MALITSDGKYLKIKEVLPTKTSYYEFENKAQREAIEDDNFSEIPVKEIYMELDLSVNPNGGKSFENNLKDLAYAKMKIFTQNKVVPTNVAVQPFAGAIDDL